MELNEITQEDWVVKENKVVNEAIMNSNVCDVDMGREEQEGVG